MPSSFFYHIQEGDRDVVSWNPIILGLPKYGMFSEAMEKMVTMIRSSEKLDWFRIASGMSACGNLTTLRSGEQFHGLAIKCSVFGYPATTSTLVAMYERW